MTKVWVFADADYDGRLEVYAAFSNKEAAEETQRIAEYGEVREVDLLPRPLTPEVLWQAHIVARLMTSPEPVSVYRRPMFPWTEKPEEHDIDLYDHGDVSIMATGATEAEAVARAKEMYAAAVAAGRVDSRYVR